MTVKTWSATTSRAKMNRGIKRASKAEQADKAQSRAKPAKKRPH